MVWGIRGSKAIQEQVEQEVNYHVREEILMLDVEGQVVENPSSLSGFSTSCKYNTGGGGGAGDSS